MNIDKYRMLLEAVDTGSLSKAAEKSLTADGERIAPILREIVKWEEQLRQVSSAICGKIVGDITIGSYFSIAANWRPSGRPRHNSHRRSRR